MKVAGKNRLGASGRHNGACGLGARRTVHHRMVRPHGGAGRYRAKLALKAHPHMLRHACGHELANDGHDTPALQAHLGHRNVQHTVRYTELSPTRFKEFWRR